MHRVPLAAGLAALASCSPPAVEKDAQCSGAFTLTVLEGAYIWNGERIDCGDLKQRFKALEERSPVPEIVLLADRNMRFQNIRDAVFAVQQADYPCAVRLKTAPSNTPVLISKPHAR